MTTMIADSTESLSVPDNHGAVLCSALELTNLFKRTFVYRAFSRVARGVSLLGASLLFCSLQLSAQPVPLGTAASYGVLAASSVTSTGLTVIRGDLGVSPGNASSVTGFTFSTPPGPGLVIGTTHFADAAAVSARNDANTAYTTLANRACNTTISGDLGGRTLVPGVYCSASAMGLTGTLTLDALGDPNAVFIFQLGSALTTASASQVRLINSAQSCSVYWQIGSAATLGTGSSFAGTMVASSSITVTTGASNSGRAIALNGAVTLDGSNMTVCSLVASSNPSISKSFSPITINASATSVLNVVLSNPNAAAATLTGSLTDNLPAGVVIASPPNASTTCAGAASPNAFAGAGSFSLQAGATIPANGSCSVSVSVTSPQAGTYLNTIPVGALVTSAGNNLAPAIATLTVLGGVIVPPIPPAAAATGVPTLSIWALLLTIMMLTIAAATVLQTRHKPQTSSSRPNR